MATQVLIAHTGQRLQMDASQLASCVSLSMLHAHVFSNFRPCRLDDFKASVARQSDIPVNCIIALTPQGKPLKLQTAQTEVRPFPRPPPPWPLG